MNLPVTKHVQLFHCLPAHSTSVKFQSHSSTQADFINSKRFESLCLSGHSMIFFFHRHWKITITIPHP